MNTKNLTAPYVRQPGYFCILRNILPEPRLLFRSTAYVLLAVGCFGISLWIPALWWPGIFLSFMAFNLIVGKIVNNVSDVIYRVSTNQHIDQKIAGYQQFLRWLEEEGYRIERED